MIEYRTFIFNLYSYLTIQICDIFQRLQHGGKDYKISAIYFLVTKISKCKLKIQIMLTDRCRSRVHFYCSFWKEKEAQNLFALV